MYKAFDLKITEEEILELVGEGDNYLFENEKLWANELDKLINTNGSFDADKIRKTWFPDIKADIFISHSHKNIDFAETLAVWLKREFGLKTFIDSQVWKSADDLLKIINTEYNEKDGCFNYKGLNKSSSNVYMILTMALARMIDKCECVFLINTPESLSVDNIINSTYSPWIFSEIMFTKLIKKKDSAMHRKKCKCFEILLEKHTDIKGKDLKFNHPIDTSHMDIITIKELEAWQGSEHDCINESENLDILYDLFETDDPLGYMDTLERMKNIGY